MVVVDVTRKTVLLQKTLKKRILLVNAVIVLAKETKQKPSAEDFYTPDIHENPSLELYFRKRISSSQACSTSLEVF